MASGLTKFMAVCLMAAVAILSSGCAGFSDRAKSLDLITRAYEKHLRWGKFEEARAFKEGAQQYLTNSERRRLQNIHVTSYDMLDSRVSADQSTAILIVRIRYVNDEYGIEKTFIDQQKWHYDASRERWFLESPIPTFR